MKKLNKNKNWLKDKKFKSIMDTLNHLKNNCKYLSHNIKTWKYINVFNLYEIIQKITFSIK